MTPIALRFVRQSIDLPVWRVCLCLPMSMVACGTDAPSTTVTPANGGAASAAGSSSIAALASGTSTPIETIPPAQLTSLAPVSGEARTDSEPSVGVTQTSDDSTSDNSTETGASNITQAPPSTTAVDSGSTNTGSVDTTPRPRVEAAMGTALVKVDVAEQHQTFEGWGTSLCWWANHVGGWSESAREAVARAVVDPVDGLGYNIFRYNIGGGENPTHDHMQQYRDMPGFLTAEGEWTWDADANQRALLLALDEVGSELIFEAFSNSPPYWMTKSECASGHSSGADNLKEDAYDAFADYLTEVVKHYHDEYGINFRTLEPLNEPYADWWKSNGSQEGCHFSPSNQERIIGAVAQHLNSKGLNETVVSASDENSMDDALRNIGTYSRETHAAVRQLNVHSYAGSKRAELRTLANDLGKRLWQSESGPLGEDISDDTDAALFMAERIIADLRELKAEAWLDWQSGDPSRSWASFTLNDQTQTHQPIKRFYMHAGFSRYIRPGATFVEIDNANMVAALRRDGAELTIVARNGDRSAARSFTFDLTSLPNVSGTASVHRVSRTEDLVELEALPIDGYSFVATLPAFSVSTFIVPLR